MVIQRHDQLQQSMIMKVTYHLLPQAQVVQDIWDVPKYQSIASSAPLDAQYLTTPA